MTEDSIAIPTPDQVTLEFEPAGLGSRFAAHVIDLIFIACLVLLLILSLVLFGVGGGSLRDAVGAGGGAATSVGIALAIALVFLVMWGYTILFEGLWRGQTPGKRQIGIRVIRDDGLPIGLAEAALRNLVRAADILPPPSYVLAGIVMHFDRHGRRLGDMAAGTLVVRDRHEVVPATAAGAAWAARVERGESRQVVTLPRGSLGAVQVDLIERFLARRSGLQPAQRSALAARLLEPILPLLVDDPEAWSRRPEAELETERLLEEVVELARADSAARPTTARESAPALY